MLDNNQQISLRNQQAIQFFQENGGIFSLATGRIQSSINYIIEQLTIRHPIITHNGAQIYCPVTKRVIYRESFMITPAVVEKISKIFGVEIMYFIDEDIYTPHKGSLIQQFEKKEQIHVMEQQITIHNKRLTKIILASDNHSLLVNVEQQLIKELDSVNTTFSEPEYLELLPQNVSKGVALNYLRENYFGADKQIITFGNNLNDIPLLMEANVGIAVSNAHSMLKKVSTQVLEKTNCEHAIEHFINQLHNKENIL